MKYILFPFIALSVTIRMIIMAIVAVFLAPHYIVKSTWAKVRRIGKKPPEWSEEVIQLLMESLFIKEVFVCSDGTMVRTEQEAVEHCALVSLMWAPVTYKKYTSKNDTENIRPDLDIRNEGH